MKSTEIIYRFVVKQSPKTSNYHVYFDDSFAARRVYEALKALFSYKISRVGYFEGFQNSITIVPGHGVEQWQNYCSQFIWPADSDPKSQGKGFFKMSTAGELIHPTHCCRCGAANPAITQTTIQGSLIREEKYCSNCSADYVDLLERAGCDG